MRYQMGGAGPHTDQMLLAEIIFAFNERSQILLFQPFDYPLTNVKDYCIFPAMSKAVTVKQGLTNGSLVIDNEELWSYVLELYNELPLMTIARSYTSHHQVANAMADDQGGDALVREKKVQHFGIRQLSAPYYDNEEAKEPSGVEMIQSIDCEGVDTSELRYKKPITSGLDMADFYQHSGASSSPERLGRER
jgi:hypothetical protein